FRGGLGRAAESTTYLRLPSLARSHREAVDRVADLLRRQGGDPRPWHAMAKALSTAGPLGSPSVLELASYPTPRHHAPPPTSSRSPVYAHLAPLRAEQAGRAHP